MVEQSQPVMKGYRIRTGVGGLVRLFLHSAHGRWALLKYWLKYRHGGDHRSSSPFVSTKKEIYLLHSHVSFVLSSR